MSKTMRTEPIRRARPAIAAALLAGIGFAAATTPVSADSFLEGKSNGMRKCVNAILGGYEVKGVNVHGHHFNCKPMSRSSSDGVNYRGILLSHDQLGIDDQYYVKFHVNSLNVVLPNAVWVHVAKGLSLDTTGVKHLLWTNATTVWLDLGLLEFEGPSAYNYTYENIAAWARAIQPREVDEWRTAAAQIFTVAIAEHGNPENRGTAPAQVSCSMPIFYEHDNYHGRSYKLSASQPNMFRVYVQNRHMGNRVSSLCVPRGWVATVYDFDDYEGASLRITGPRQYEDLERQRGSNGARLNWGDRISSISVTKATPLPSQADSASMPGKSLNLPLKLPRRSD